MNIFRLVSHRDGLWIESTDDEEPEWEIVDGPFGTRAEALTALRMQREREDRSQIYAA